MKKYRIPALLLAVFTLLAFSSCDMIQNFIASRTRPIKLIEIYNSNLQKTLKMVPNDTLYVKVQGLSENKGYTIQCLDPDNKVISEIITTSDENGFIGTAPLWYDVGFQRDPTTGRPYLDTSSELLLRAFNIRVFSNEDDGESTDFKQPFFFISNTNLERPQPIVMVGKSVTVSGTDRFFLENAFYSDNPANSGPADIIHVKIANMTELPKADTSTARLYVVPFNGEVYQGGENIDQNAWFYQECTLADLTSDTGVILKWPINAGHTAFQDEVPQVAEGKAFSVILDTNNNGIYEITKEGAPKYYLDGIDGNGVPGFIVKTPPISTADYVPINLASGGIFSWSYISNYGWTASYDYRDVFAKAGTDTNYASHSGEFWGYGIKVIWNPYQYPSSWPAGKSMPSNFWGSTVDVFIVNSSQSLNTNSEISDLAPGTTKKRLPVQYGCANGYWQQTIWRAPMTPGHYMVIVDMDQSGTVTDKDLVDNVDSNGNPRFDPTNKPAGFSVY